MADWPRSPQVHVAISLDGSGDFDGPDDEVTSFVHHERGVEIDEGRDGTQQLSPPKVSAGGFALKNGSGRFSQEQANSPYYQRLIPGRPVEYRATHGVSTPYREHAPYREHDRYRGRLEYPLGRHLIDDISQQTEFGQRRVNIETLGYETVLTRAPVTVPLMVEPLISECFVALLDAVSWPADKRDIATSDTRLLLWWCDERPPWTAMLELLDSEGPGMFGVRRDGTFYFESRNSRTINERSTTSMATFDDRDTGGLYFTSFQYDPGLKNVKNRATYTTRRRSQGSEQAIWEYGESLVLTANQSQTLFVRPTDPFLDAVEPVEDTDYTVSAGSATVTMTYSAGFLAILNVQAGGSGATIEGLQLRAKPLTLVSETTVQNTFDASESIARFSPIPGANIPLTLQVNGWPEIAPAVAEGVCNAWVVRQHVPRPHLTFTIPNADGDHLREILRLRESDRVTLTESNTGLSADVWINSGHLRIAGAGGRITELVVGAEKCDTVEGMVWDVDAWDEGEWGI